MTLFEILNFNKEMLNRLVKAGFKPEDCRFIELYADYRRMYGQGDKVTYIVNILSERYQVSERKVYSLIRKFGMDCTDRAV